MSQIVHAAPLDGWTLAPALGWPVGGALVAVMVALAVVEVTLHIRRHHAGTSDETVAACVRRTLSALLVAVMLLTPATVASTTSRAVNATDVVVAVDVTGSMAVRDASYGDGQADGSDGSANNDGVDGTGEMTRLDAAKRAVHDLTGLYRDASFAALRFGASGTLDVPLTPDELAIQGWADTLSVEATSVSAGSSLDAPLDQLLLTLKSIRESHPDDTLLLYVITDGEQTSPRSRRTFSSLRRYLDGAFTVGVGSSEGGRIPVTEDGLTDGGNDAGSEDAEDWVTDPSTGQPGVSKLDEDNLKAIADELSGTYLPLTDGSTLADGQSAQASRQWRVTTTAKRRTRITPVVWPLAAALALLLAWEAGAWIATSRRMI